MRWGMNAWLLVAALLLLWFVLCRFLSNEWSANEQYNYGWFVPFFALFLFWQRWERRPPLLRISEFELRNPEPETSEAGESAIRQSVFRTFVLSPFYFAGAPSSPARF